MTVKPRREVVLGGETRLVDLAFTFARPLAETVLLGIDRWYRTGDEAAPRPGAPPALADAREQERPPAPGRVTV